MNKQITAPWQVDRLDAAPATYANFINGAFDAASPDLIEVTNPATGAALGKVPASTPQDVDRAVAAARGAQPEWEALPAIERAAYLRQISAGIRKNAEALSRVIVQEQGKIRGLADVEVAFTADYIDYMAEWARRIEGEILTSDRRDETILLQRKPLGVVAGILPWNFPFFLIARKMAPALITGNTIVVKPSEETPLNAFAFAELVSQTDLPAGVFNLVSGDGAGCGAALAGHTGIDMVSFTGSVTTGTRIMQAAAANLTRVNLELGGKAPAIVMEDADLDLAVEAIYQSRVINTGQVCNCAERVYVARSVHDAFVAKMKERMETTRFGDPSEDADLAMGPLINAAAVDRIDRIVAAARDAGAKIVTGGAVADLGQGHHYQPTLITNVDGSMDVVAREVFGPVLPVQAVEGLDEALALANDTEYGLTSSVYTSNINTAMKAARVLKFGETYINRENFEAMQGFHAGRKKSGIGGADGKHGLYEFTQTHVVYLQGH